MDQVVKSTNQNPSTKAHSPYQGLRLPARSTLPLLALLAAPLSTDAQVFTPSSPRTTQKNIELKEVGRKWTSNTTFNANGVTYFKPGFDTITNTIKGPINHLVSIDVTSDTKFNFAVSMWRNNTLVSSNVTETVEHNIGIFGRSTTPRVTLNYIEDGQGATLVYNPIPETSIINNNPDGTKAEVSQETFVLFTKVEVHAISPDALPAPEHQRPESAVGARLTPQVQLVVPLVPHKFRAAPTLRYETVPGLGQPESVDAYGNRYFNGGNTVIGPGQNRIGNLRVSPNSKVRIGTIDIK